MIIKKILAKYMYYSILIFILIIILLILSSWLKYSQITGSSEFNINETIVWKNQNIYSDKDIIRLIEFIENNIKGFEPLNSNELEKLSVFAKKSGTPLEQLIALRHIVSTQRSIDAKKSSRKYYYDIKKSYEQNSNNAAKFFKSFSSLPPLEVIKILGENVNKKIQEYALNHDSENPKTYEKILIDSDKFEDELSSWISKNYPKIKFKTQKELIEEQTIKYGRPVATPDILFDEPVVIKITDPNGTEKTVLIKWMDAKNYTFIKIPFIMQSINKQSEKYFQNYGPGAFVFHYGFTQGLHIPNTIILDASFIKN